jgi:hypothetical protein
VLHKEKSKTSADSYSHPLWLPKHETKLLPGLIPSCKFH